MNPNKQPIYLDYMATTPVDPRVVEIMMEYLGPQAHFGNPTSLHSFGRYAAEGVELAREQMSDHLNVSPSSIIFTSGATEANNLAILGAARFYQRKGRHLITVATEHKSVLDSFKHLEHAGFEVTYLSPESDGLLSLETLQAALRKDTILVSVMHVNNEIGVIQNIETIGEYLKGRGIIFHVDAAQSAGKLRIDLSELSIDLMSISAHKIYGPKGVGALYIRQKPRVRLEPQSFGGNHERGLRPGTLASHQIVGMGKAFALAFENLEEENLRLTTLRNRLWDGIRHLNGIQLNGSLTQRIAGNLNVSFKGIDGEQLLPALHELALSSTSACLSASMQPSYVLKAIGLCDKLAYSSLRISFGRFTTEEEITYSIKVISTQINQLLGVH